MIKNIIILILMFLTLALTKANPGVAYQKETLKPILITEPVEASVSTEKPVSFYIPKIYKSAQVVAVGLDETSRTPIPEENNKVAWYKFGGKLGENGSVVLAGHHFWNNAPGVFGELKNLRIGDRIEVTGETGKNYIFEVREIETYQRTAFPSEKIYFSSDTQRLTLITCAGKYDNAVKDYDQRLVVYAVRIE